MKVDEANLHFKRRTKWQLMATNGNLWQRLIFQHVVFGVKNGFFEEIATVLKDKIGKVQAPYILPCRGLLTRLRLDA